MQLQPGPQEYTCTITRNNLNFLYDYKPDSNHLILFLHGLACSRESFANVFDDTYFPNISLLLPDLIGFGKSSKPADFSYTMQAQAAVCEELLSHFSFQHLHIVAHSMGNPVALLFSPDVFARVRSFTNIEGNLIGEDCGLMSRGIVGTSLQDYQTQVFPAHQIQFAQHPELRFNQTTAIAVYKSAQSLVKWSDSGELLVRFKKLGCKKCYVWGEENRGMPALARLDFVKTFMVPASGHGLMTDNPQAFYQLLQEFINSTIKDLPNF